MGLILTPGDNTIVLRHGPYDYYNLDITEQGKELAIAKGKENLDILAFDGDKLIVTSTALRAYQTGQAIAEGINYGNDVIEIDELSTNYHGSPHISLGLLNELLQSRVDLLLLIVTHGNMVGGIAEGLGYEGNKIHEARYLDGASFKRK